MTDVLIRDVPDDVLASIDAKAARLGLSRGEFLRRQLEQEAVRSQTAVDVDDLRRFAETFRDLADPDVMKEAWE